MSQCVEDVRRSRARPVLQEPYEIGSFAINKGVHHHGGKPYLVRTPGEGFGDGFFTGFACRNWWALELRHPLRGTPLIEESDVSGFALFLLFFFSFLFCFVLPTSLIN